MLNRLTSTALCARNCTSARLAKTVNDRNSNSCSRDNHVCNYRACTTTKLRGWPASDSDLDSYCVESWTKDYIVSIAEKKCLKHCIISIKDFITRRLQIRGEVFGTLMILMKQHSLKLQDYLLFREKSLISLTTGERLVFPLK